MSETTEGMTVQDALRAMLGWIEEGREIEYFLNGRWLPSIIWTRIYRPKPRKPLAITRQPHECKFYEGTPEVLAALKAAGIEV